MNAKLLGVVAIFAMVACGDDSTSGGGGAGAAGGAGGSGGGTGAAGGTGGTGGTGGVGGGTGANGGTGGSGGGLDCAAVCSDLYDCGVEDGNCPGFSGDPAEKTAFVGDETGGCIATCTSTPILAQFVDPANCGQTVETVSGASGEFDTVCQDGFGGGGTGGGGN